MQVYKKCDKIIIVILYFTVSPAPIYGIIRWSISFNEVLFLNSYFTPLIFSRIILIELLFWRADVFAGHIQFLWRVLYVLL